jgi:hypothetical protein
MHAAIRSLTKTWEKNMQFQKKFIKRSISIFSLSLLLAIPLSARPVIPINVPFLVAQPRSEAELALQRRLMNLGIQFVQLGDEVRISIPLQHLFLPGSLILKYKGLILLQQVITLLNQQVIHQGIRIKVTPERSYATLASQQEIIIADHLVRHHLNTPLIITSEALNKDLGASMQQDFFYKIPVAALYFRLLHPEEMQ